MIAARPGVVGDQVIRLVVFRVARRVLTGRLRNTGDPLGGRLTRHEVTGILGAAAAEFARLTRGLPDEPTAGSRLCVRLAAWTLALDRALQARGVAPADSRTLTADVAWAAYRPFVAASALPARLFVREPRARLRALARSGQRFPFNPPGWRFNRIGGGGVRGGHHPLPDRGLPAQPGRGGPLRRCLVRTGRPGRRAVGRTVAPYRNARDRRSGLRLPL